MPWHHNHLNVLERRRGANPPSAEEEALRAKVDACVHKRTSRIGKSACLHCRDCGSTYMPEVTGKPSRAMHSTPGGSGTGLEHLGRMQRLEEEQEAARHAEHDEGGMAAPVEEKAIVDAPSVKGPKPGP